MKGNSLPARLVSVVLLLAFLVGCIRAPVLPTIIYHTGLRQEVALWRMFPDGSEITQITSSGWFGAYSPDNSKIAYSEFYDDGIWVVDADGKHPVRLTDFGSDPSWSPRGNRLVFSAGGTAGKDRYLWIVNANGTDVHQLSTVNGSHADWSLGGELILFHGEVNNGIWQIAPDGSQEKMLYAGGGYPAWSPDGEEIVYVDLRDWCIWVMRADGTDRRKLTDHTGMLPSWAAGGRQIAYEGVCEDKDGNKKECIWMINSDGSDDHAINEEGRAPDWSN